MSKLVPWTSFTSYYPRETLDLLTSAHERCIKCVLTIDCQVYTCQNRFTHQEIIDDVLILMMLKQKTAFPWSSLLWEMQLIPTASTVITEGRKIFFAFYVLLIIPLFSMLGLNPFYQCIDCHMPSTLSHVYKTVHYFFMCESWWRITEIFHWIFW